MYIGDTDSILPLFTFLTNMFEILGVRSLLLSVQPMMAKMRGMRLKMTKIYRILSKKVQQISKENPFAEM
jgi:hypothetical protein